jgi:hypothetical protein
MQRHYGDERPRRVEFRIIVAVYAYLLESMVLLAAPAGAAHVTTIVAPGRRGS